MYSVENQAQVIQVDRMYRAMSDTEGVFSNKGKTICLSRQDGLKQGDYYEFKFVNPPPNFAFLGFVLGKVKDDTYKVVFLNGAEEYRREIDGTFHICLKLPFASDNQVVRLLFGPKNQKSGKLTYAFVSDPLIISEDDMDRFFESEAIILWKLYHKEDFNRRLLGQIIEEDFNLKKKRYLTNAFLDKVQLPQNFKDEILEVAFGDGSSISKSKFLTFWRWYGYIRAAILKLPKLWSDGRVYGHLKIAAAETSVLGEESTGSSVIYFPKEPNKILVSHVVSEEPRVVCHKEFYCDEVGDDSVTRYVAEQNITRYYKNPSLWRSNQQRWGFISRVYSQEI